MIEIGQDAMGRWAFLIRDESGKVVASDDDFDTAEQALTFATHKAHRLTEGK